jgi:hypothetical protein
MKIKPAYAFYTLLMVSNIVSLYFIIDMANYDEMVSYLKNGEEKFSSPRQVVVVYLITCLGNLLFISALLMRSIVFSGTRKVNLS